MPGRYRYSVVPEVVTYTKERNELGNENAAQVPEGPSSDKTGNMTNGGEEREEIQKGAD